MDKSERVRLKQLANEAIIATFGYDNRESQLAEGLEKVIDELEDSSPPHCPTCHCPLPGMIETVTI